ncbi:MAG: Lrp/AsnC family transcriptional regulator [Thermoplasmata archaeon]|nr:Lrp/AsnC family transcriptional regulator [Thermoplasmata archaeon]
MAGSLGARESGNGRTLDTRIVDELERLRGRISFGGLRRALAAHPESLSRALRRLEREGVVDRTDDGYRLLTAGGPQPGDPWASDRVLAELKLPPGFNPTTAVDRLNGRWFGSLRWVGASQRGGEHRLVWSRRDGTGDLVLALQSGSIRILTTNGDERLDAPEDEEAAYELMFHALDQLRVASDPRISHAVFLSATRWDVGWAS